MPSLVSFNANNFFLRYRFSRAYPGSRSKSDVEEATTATIGYLPTSLGGYSPKNYIVWDPVRRQTAAAAMLEPDNKFPDIICFQEVENIQAIRAFNNWYLDRYYPYSLLIDGYDPRNIDVGILSRFPIHLVKSHIDDTRGKERIFSRDCLEAVVDLPGGEQLTLLVNHLKSKLVTKEKNQTKASYDKRVRQSHNRRRLQASTIARFVDERFKGRHDTALYAVIGDFNDTPYSPYLRPLLSSRHLTDIVRELRGEADSWTYYWRARNRVSQIDYVLVSKELARRIRRKAAHGNRVPHIERGGLAYKQGVRGDILRPKLIHFEPDDVTRRAAGKAPAPSKLDFDFPRYKEVKDDWRNNVSDHCPVKIWF